MSPPATPGEIFYARLAGPCNADGGYPWAEVVDAPGGTWQATGRTGSADDDPAYPIHPNDRLDGIDRVFELRRLPRTGEIRFADGAGYYL